MYEWMHEYMYVCMHVCMYVCMYVYVYIICIHVLWDTHIYMYTHTYCVWQNIRSSTCLCICMCIYIDVCIYICIYTHIFKHIYALKPKHRPHVERLPLTETVFCKAKPLSSAIVTEEQLQSSAPAHHTETLTPHPKTHIWHKSQNPF